VLNKRWRTKSGAEIVQFTLSYRLLEDNEVEYFLSIDIPNTTKKYIFTIQNNSIYYKPIYLGSEVSYAADFQLVEKDSIFLEKPILDVWYYHYAYKVLYHHIHTNSD